MRPLYPCGERLLQMYILRVAGWRGCTLAGEHVCGAANVWINVWGMCVALGGFIGQTRECGGCRPREG